MTSSPLVDSNSTTWSEWLGTTTRGSPEYLSWTQMDTNKPTAPTHRRQERARTQVYYARLDATCGATPSSTPYARHELHWKGEGRVVHQHGDVGDGHVIGADHNHATVLQLAEVKETTDQRQTTKQGHGPHRTTHSATHDAQRHNTQPRGRKDVPASLPPRPARRTELDTHPPRQTQWRRAEPSPRHKRSSLRSAQGGGLPQTTG